MNLAWWLRATVALLRRPDLWWTAACQVVRLARPGWAHRAPFLPVPDEDYLRFRMVTAYGGDGTATPAIADLVRYLEWCRAWPHVA